MNVFDWDTLLIWALSWLISLGFSCAISLTGTLRGIAGGMDFLNISARVLNAYLCPFPSLDIKIARAGFCSA